MTISFHNLATENKIVLFRLLPHSKYLTQPLNLGVFQLFKHYYILKNDLFISVCHSTYSTVSHQKIRFNIEY